MRRILPLLATAGMLIGASCSISTVRNSDGGIFRSDNLGETWAQKVFIRQERKRIVLLDGVNIRFLRYDRENTLYLITRENGIWRSTNHGDTWSATGFTRGGPADFTIDPESTAIQYLAAGNTVQKSSDTGNTWQVIYSSPRAGEAITGIVVDPRNPAHLLALTSVGSVLTSNDSGVTWRVISFQPFGFAQVLMHPQTAQILYAITSVGPMKSLDGGTSWRSLADGLAQYPGGAQFNALSFLPGSPEVLYAATNAGFLTSPDGGATWTNVPNLVPLGTPVTTMAVRDVRTYLVVTNNRLLKSTDGARTWRTLSVPTGRAIVYLSFDPRSPESVYLGTLRVKR